MSQFTVEKFSRFPVTEFSSLPDDLQTKMKDYALENGEMLNIFRALSYRPTELRAFLSYYEAVMVNRGSLTVADKEMIVVAVSAFNKCNCCIVIHGAFHRVLSKNPLLADQISSNWETAELDDRQRAILTFAMDVCQCRPLTDEKVAALEKHGLSRDDAWDIGSVVALISLANRMANMLDVKPNHALYSLGRDVEAAEADNQKRVASL